MIWIFYPASIYFVLLLFPLGVKTVMAISEMSPGPMAKVPGPGSAPQLRLAHRTGRMTSRLQTSRLGFISTTFHQEWMMLDSFWITFGKLGKRISKLLTNLGGCVSLNGSSRIAFFNRGPGIFEAPSAC